MKLICLNVWGGRVYEPLMKFVREQAESTDIFCFQEVYRSPRKDIEKSHEDRIHILDELIAALPDFNHIFHSVTSDVDSTGPVDLEIEIGQAEFVKKSVPISSFGEIPISSSHDWSLSREQAFSPKNFGYVKLPFGNKVITVLNIHGLTSKKDDKLDTPERLEQSRVIKEFALQGSGPAIICGDFNILPKAQSITTFENSFIDLIKKYKIATTRSKISPWHGTPGEFKFSDYAFVSPELEISNFEVPDVEISDHLPLIMEFR